MFAPITDSECLAWGRSFFAAPVRRNGVFRLAQMQRPADKPGRWITSLLENRDTSNLARKAVEAIRTGSAIIVDGADSSAKLAPESGRSLRTVSVFAEQADHCPLISLGRRDEQLSDSGSSLALEMLEEARRLLAERHGTLLRAPLISLDPELNTQLGRRTFHRQGVSYAIRVNGGERFFPPPWSSDDPLDRLKSDSAENIFDIYFRRRDEADPAAPVVVPLNDLPEGRAGALTPAYVEFLFRFLTPAGAEYFLVRDAQPPGTIPAVLKQGAVRLALKAAKYLGGTPGEALRLHQFQHPHADRYCAAVRIADRCRCLEAKLGKDPEIS